MSSRRALLESLLLSRLPAEFQEVEYLESSGTQYIDTGWVPSYNSQVKISFKFTQRLNLSDESIFGSRSSSGAKYNLYIYNGFIRLSVGYGDVYNENTLSISQNQFYDVIFTGNGTTCVLSGELSKTAISNSTPTFETTLTLFGRKQSRGTIQPATYSCSAIKYLQIYDNGTLVRNFIPCYRKADNVAGLYDLVNGVFYTNAGTGTFIVGGNV